jgi:hypothetical protein
MLFECFNTLYQQSPGCLMNTLYNIGGTTVRNEPRTLVNKPATVKQVDRKGRYVSELRKNLFFTVFFAFFSSDCKMLYMDILQFKLKMAPT